MKRIISTTFASTVLLAGAGFAVAQPPRVGPPEVALAQPDDPRGRQTAPQGDVLANAPPVAFDAAPVNRNGGLSFGVGFYLIKPFWESNAAFTVSTFSLTPAGDTARSFQNHDFQYGFELAPRVFVSYVSDSGLGGRVGWWHFDQSARAAVSNGPNLNPAIVIDAPDGFGGVSSDSTRLAPDQKDAIAIAERVVVDVWDFDITQRFLQNDRWLLTAGAGIRYTYLSQTYSARLDRSGPVGGTISDESHFRSTLNVAGPNVLVEGKRVLGNGRLALYANARAGVLFGTSRQTICNTLVSNFGGGANTTDTTNDTNGRNNDLIPFLDTEAGIEWLGSGCGAIQPFLRFGVVGQTWWGNGAPQDVDHNFGFFGFTFTGGINY